MSATLTTGDALLQAILADPADDSVRLVYADHLEESGEAERAEFIRAQVELANMPRIQSRAQADHYDALRRRERALLETPTALRTTADPEPWKLAIVKAGVRWEYRRGFVWSVSLPCADWLRHGPRLVRLQPLERVRLADREPTRYGNQRLMHPPGPYWRWFPVAVEGKAYYPDSHPSELPRPLWAAYAELCRAENWSREHPTEGAAWDALSRACLSWARSQEPA